MKNKMLKKLISIICSVTMAAQFTVTSVGAVKDGCGITAEEAVAVDKIHGLIRDSIGELEKIADKVRTIKGYSKDTKKLLLELNEIKELLESTNELELCGSSMIEATNLTLTVSVTPVLKSMSEAFSNYDIDTEDLSELLNNPCQDYSNLKFSVERLVEGIKFSDELSKKYRELGKAKRLIKKMADSTEKTRLQQLCKNADEAFEKKIYSIVSKNKKRKEKLCGLVDTVVNEIEIACNAQKNNNIKLPATQGVSNEQSDKIRKEEIRKAIDEEMKKEEEERKKQEEERKRQKEELTKRKVELEQKKCRLEKESNEWNQKVKDLGKIRPIYHGWYNKEELSILRPLIVIGYELQNISSELQKISSELKDMDMPKNVVNMPNVNKEFNNMDEEKKLIFEKFEANRKLLNLEDESKSMEYFIKNKIDCPWIKDVQANFNAAKKEMEEINQKIKKEIERRDKANSDFMAGFKVIGII